MPIFENSYYGLGKNQFCDTERYKKSVENELDKMSSKDEKTKVLHDELIELTRHITEGIRDLIKYDRRVRDLVLNQGVIPLATWADSLDNKAFTSLLILKNKVNDMKQELEDGKVEGLLGTMFLHNKPTFETFEKFYDIIFDLADEVENSESGERMG